MKELIKRLNSDNLTLADRFLIITAIMQAKNDAKNDTFDVIGFGTRVKEALLNLKD